MTERVRSRILRNVTWQGKFEVAIGGSEMEEGSSDPASADKPFGEVMGVGEHIDSSINGRYVNALGQVVDNGDDNFDYIVTLHILCIPQSYQTPCTASSRILWVTTYPKVQAMPGKSWTRTALSMMPGMLTKGILR